MSDQQQQHVPVLLNQVMAALKPETGKHYVDGTLGAGGHSEAILEASGPEGMLSAFDLDPAAIAIAAERLKRFGNRVRIINDSYVSIKKHFDKTEKVDGVLLDLGVSSMQLDNAERGFSFLKDGPLDMRFGKQAGRSAEELVNTLPEAELAQILFDYGEERESRRIAAAICRARESAKISSTLQLAEIIAGAVKAGRHKIHPATRSFQAIRIAVNNELNGLRTVLPDFLDLLNPNGRLAIISFHSLEDRIVKQFFRQESTDCLCPPEQPLCTCGHRAQLKLISRHAIVAGQEETEENVRSRSAKLRVAEKLENRR